jgi:hypothetical protein
MIAAQHHRKLVVLQRLADQRACLLEHRADGVDIARMWRRAGARLLSAAQGGPAGGERALQGAFVQQLDAATGAGAPRAKVRVDFDQRDTRIARSQRVAAL